MVRVQINDDDEVVGVAFQTLSAHDTENIGYVIPVDVVLHFLEDISRHGAYTGTGQHTRPHWVSIASGTYSGSTGDAPFLRLCSHCVDLVYMLPGFCSLGVAFQSMESPSLRKHKNLPVSDASVQDKDP